MISLPSPIESLIEQLIRLPGIGRRGAERIVTHLMQAPPEQARTLGEAFAALRSSIQTCTTCGHWSEGPQCTICADPHRADGRLCIVERPADVLTFEQSGAFDGRYHVLGGTLSPLGGVTPEDLNIAGLAGRIKAEGIEEVIVATNPTVEGDATALFLAQDLEPTGVLVARIGLGLPLGANLGYADAGTLKLAIDGRRKM